MLDNEAPDPAKILSALDPDVILYSHRRLPVDPSLDPNSQALVGLPDIR